MNVPVKLLPRQNYKFWAFCNNYDLKPIIKIAKVNAEPIVIGTSSLIELGYIRPITDVCIVHTVVDRDYDYDHDHLFNSRTKTEDDLDKLIEIAIKKYFPYKIWFAYIIMPSPIGSPMTFMSLSWLMEHKHEFFST